MHLPLRRAARNWQEIALRQAAGRSARDHAMKGCDFAPDDLARSHAYQCTLTHTTALTRNVFARFRLAFDQATSWHAANFDF
jgi:hypothetical protein